MTSRAIIGSGPKGFIFVKGVLIQAFLLFVFFLFARFAGFAYFPGWRYLNLFFLAAPLAVYAGFSIPFYKGNSPKPISFFISTVCSYLLFTGLFMLYLGLDSWYAEFIYSYTEFDLLAGPGSFGLVMLWESFLFAMILFPLSWLLHEYSADKNLYTE